MILDFRWFDLARHRFGLWIGREKDNNMNKTSGSRPKDSSSNNPKSKNKNPKFVLVVGAMLFAICWPVQAQQTGKVPRIGLLYSVCRLLPPRLVMRHFDTDCASLAMRRELISCWSIDMRIANWIVFPRLRPSSCGSSWMSSSRAVRDPLARQRRQQLRSPL
jgi:hypothetical protein